MSTDLLASGSARRRLAAGRPASWVLAQPARSMEHDGRAKRPVICLSGTRQRRERPADHLCGVGSTDYLSAGGSSRGTGRHIIGPHTTATWAG